MTVSVKAPSTAAPKKSRKPTLREQLDDALADAAGLEAALEDEQNKSAELEAKLNSVSSGVEYADEYAVHSKKRQAALDKALKKVKRRDDQIIKMKAAQVVLRDLHADSVIECIDANDKIAVQAQELVGLREQLKEANAESAHNAQAASLLTQQVDAVEQTLEGQYASMMRVIDARGARIDDLDLENEELRNENARLKSAEYLHNRPSYVRGALSAVRAVGRLVSNRGGVR